MYTRGLVYVLDSGQSTQLHCVFAVNTNRKSYSIVQHRGEVCCLPLCCCAGDRAVMYSHGLVYVLDSGQSTQLDCVFAMRDFTHFDSYRTLIGSHTCVV